MGVTIFFEKISHSYYQKQNNKQNKIQYHELIEIDNTATLTPTSI